MKKSIPLKMRISVAKCDAQNASTYYDHTSCLFATCLKRHFPNHRVNVSGWSCHIDGIRYHMGNNSHKIHQSYRDGTNNLIPMDTFKPFKITLNID